MTWLQEKLKEMGATPSQITSGTVRMVETAIAEEAGFVDRAAMEQITRLADTFERAKEISAEIQKETQSALYSAKRDAEFAKQEINRAISCYQKAKESANGVIQDKELAEAVKAYKAVLEATKEVFGDNCTEIVISEAIRAGSYTAWRGIMGPKEQSGVSRRL